jgi:hypothetical protein
LNCYVSALFLCQYLRQSHDHVHGHDDAEDDEPVARAAASGTAAGPRAAPGTETPCPSGREDKIRRVSGKEGQGYKRESMWKGGQGSRRVQLKSIFIEPWLGQRLYKC